MEGEKMRSLKYLICVFALCLLVGCSKGYKEGEYTGTAVDSYGGQENTASAKVTVDSEGKITDVYLDTTYTTKDGVTTTKKTLGNDYNMKTYQPDAAGEWFEQVEKLEQAVIDNQGIDFLNLDDDGKTDAVSGCTIVIDALYEALEDALNQAK